MDKFDPEIKKREKFYRWFFLVGDKYKVFLIWFNGLCIFFFTTALLLFILTFLFYIGFNYSEKTKEGLISAFRILFIIIFLAKFVPVLLFLKKPRNFTFLFKTLVFLFCSGIFISNFILNGHEIAFWKPLYGNTQIIVAIIFIGISEISRLSRLLSAVKISPALIFSLSFLIIILTGSGLLLLPKAHTGQLSYLDSLFTSVSAVCVTGLVVVNTSTAFTILGKIIIICLIQIGGLGIMTFTGFFSYIFTVSGSSFRDRLLLKELFSSESLNNLFTLLVNIIILTFLTEMAGAIIIYASLDWHMEDKVLFSVFHSVSAFCNAGFSTLPDGLFSPVIRYNYNVHITLAILIILGGIGFPVLVSLYSFLKHSITVLIRKLQSNRIPVTPGKKNYSIRIVLFMTLFLILAGTVCYYFFESGSSLQGFNKKEKLIISLFSSVSARTAGFNITDISLWSYPTIFIMIILMWIGASPGSTGGGIKTTTFALAFRSVWNNLRGREHLIIGNREISNSTINRVLSIIFLSLVIITGGFFCLLIFESDKNPVHLLFECVSAFGTVGLSLANTASFSNEGKMVIILLMFIGRVGPLTLFSGFVLSHRKKYSRYPELDIIIN